MKQPLKVGDGVAFCFFSNEAFSDERKILPVFRILVHEMTSGIRYIASKKTALLQGSRDFKEVREFYVDYYPFGMMQPGRVYNSPEYRYGFNGMEKDDEIKGDGNSYTTHFRQYDPRLARWLSLDPEMKKFPHQSPYVAFNNSPIFYKDPTGAEGEPTEEEKEEIQNKTKKAVTQAAQQQAENEFYDWVGGYVNQEEDNPNTETEVNSTVDIKKDDSPYTNDALLFEGDVSLSEDETINAHLLYEPSKSNNTIVDVDIINKDLAFFDGAGMSLAGRSVQFNVDKGTNSRVSAYYIFTDNKSFSNFVSQYNKVKRGHMLKVAKAYDVENGTNYHQTWKNHYDNNNYDY